MSSEEKTKIEKYTRNPISLVDLYSEVSRISVDLEWIKETLNTHSNRLDDLNKKLWGILLGSLSLLATILLQLFLSKIWF